jgi:transposase-like protein
MEDQLLTVQEAARRMGITTASLYGWLAQSDTGTLQIRGQSVTIDYLQGGAKGQGRIRIEAQEIERLKELMRVKPLRPVPRRPSIRPAQFPGITVPLGRPDLWR